MPLLFFRIALALTIFPSVSWALYEASLNNLVEISKDSRYVQQGSFEGRPYDAGETGLPPSEARKLAKPIRIRYLKFTLSAVAGRPVVIVPGMRESATKYLELAGDLSSRGFGPIYAIDHRGQGASDDIRSYGSRNQTTRVLYVDKFENYVLDLKKFLEIVSAENNGARADLIGHSMGGAIVSLLALKHPDARIGKIALSAPMWNINGSKVELARMCSFRSSLRALACEEPQGSPASNMEEATHSEIRFRSFERLREAHGIPQRSVTAQWGKEALAATAEIRRLGAPPGALVLSAQQDVKVSSLLHASLCRAARNCSHRLLVGSRHEPLQESDEVRNMALRYLLNFLRGKPLDAAVEDLPL